VAYISLVKKPANKRDIVYKSADNQFNQEKEIRIVKSEPEGLVHGTVYEPNVKDADGDWADRDTIRKAAHDFMARGDTGKVDTNHDEKPSGARVVESHVNEKGAWEVVIKMDPKGETFQQVEKGELKGLSMGALCEKSDEEPPREQGAGEGGEVLKAVQGLQASLDKLAGRIEAVEKSVARVPKSRQINIEGEKVNIEKGSDDSLSEFNFKDLA